MVFGTLFQDTECNMKHKIRDRRFYATQGGAEKACAEKAINPAAGDAREQAKRYIF